MENTILNKIIKEKIDLFKLYVIISKKEYFEERLMFSFALLNAPLIIIFMQKNNSIFYIFITFFYLSSIGIFFTIKELKIKNKMKKLIKKINPNFFNNNNSQKSFFTQ